MITLGIVNQESGMNLEKFREQRACGLGHVTARAALDLRKIGLAYPLALLLADRLYQLELRHGPV